jgi:hypothetical protein
LASGATRRPIAHLTITRIWKLVEDETTIPYFHLVVLSLSFLVFFPHTASVRIFCAFAIMRWLLSFLLLGFWGACVHALSSSGSRLLVVLEEDKSLYSTFWADLKGTFYVTCHPAE